jgi:hypothetical protein
MLRNFREYIELFLASADEEFTMTRDEAVRLIAQKAMHLLSMEERRTLIEEWWVFTEEIPDLSDELCREVTIEEGPSDSDNRRYDPLVQHGLQTQLRRVSNKYLSEKLRELGYADEINEPEPELLACPCCLYKTLTRRGHYDVCPVCFWEDDGGNNPSRYSSPNHLTLEDGRRNFARLGACAIEHVNHVDREGTRKYRI